MRQHGANERVATMRTQQSVQILRLLATTVVLLAPHPVTPVTALIPTTFVRFTQRQRRPPLLGVSEPFGEQAYWETWYQNRTRNNDADDAGDFSWYGSWHDLAPFVEEFLHNNSNHDPIMLAGIGMDAPLLLDMLDSGYRNLWAMDYAPASIDYIAERWKQYQQENSFQNKTPPPLVDLQVADVRDLPYESNSLHLILDKGTLDAVYLNGETPGIRLDNLERGVKELQRCLQPRGGVFWSLSGVCVDAMDDQRWFPPTEWECLCDTRDGVLFSTEDGYTSNNLDGSLMVWRKR